MGSAKPAYSASKQRVMSHLQVAHATTDSDHSVEVETLKRQIADISAQLNSMTAESQKQKLPKQKAKSLASSAKAEAYPIKKKGTSQQSPTVKMSSKPCSWYCFQCGEDGHIASACDNEPTPSLVAVKKTQLREKQAIWESSKCALSLGELN